MSESLALMGRVLLIGLPFLVWAGLFVAFYGRKRSCSQPSMAESIVCAGVAYSLAVAVGTEGLSLFRLIDTPSVIAFHLLLAGIVWGWAWRRGAGLRDVFGDFRGKVRSLSAVERSVLAMAICFYIFPLAVSGVLYPPNTPDSMTYHLPRVEHWIQNASVQHFPTSDHRQNYLNVMAEYWFLHLRLLLGSDRLSNFVQFSSFLHSFAAVSLTTRASGGGRRGSWLSMIVLLTLPMGIAQSVTTQVDETSGFFLLAAIGLGALAARGKKTVWNGVWSAVSLALGVATKNTIYLFAFPFGLWFGWRIWRREPRSGAILTIVTALLIFIVASPLYLRNFQTSGHVLGASEFYSTQNPWSPAHFSNLVRNVGLHLGTPLPGMNRLTDKCVSGIHKVLGLKLNSPQSTFSGTSYETVFALNEDGAGNFVTLILFVWSVFFLIRSKGGRPLLWRSLVGFGLCLGAGFFLFSFLLRWQPWGSRLQLPWFMVASSWIGSILSVRLRGPIVSDIWNFRVPSVSQFLLVSSAVLASTGLLIVWLKPDFGPLWEQGLAFAAHFSTPEMMVDRARRLLQNHGNGLIPLNLLGFAAFGFLATCVAKVAEMGNGSRVAPREVRSAWLSVALMAMSFPFVVFSKHRPLLGPIHSLRAPRFTNYFLGQGYSTAEMEATQYKRIVEQIKLRGATSIGLDISQNNAYEFWVLLRKELTSFHLGYARLSRYKVPRPSKEPVGFDVIISEVPGILDEVGRENIAHVDFYSIPHIQELEKEWNIRHGQFWVVYAKDRFPSLKIYAEELDNEIPIKDRPGGGG